MSHAVVPGQPEMRAALPVTLDELSSAVVGRSTSLLGADLTTFADAIRGNVAGRRLLVVGGAGSIGGATVRTLLAYEPASVDVVDVNENALAELVRDIRSADRGGRCSIRAVPLDFGSPLMERWLRQEPAYDSVLNFAAVKHVRSEKNVVSVLHMLDVNVLRAVRLLEWLEASGFAGRYFSVSTDKAADPVNLMGASKRLMELAMFAAAPPGVSTSSARFANVAFSNGSLLEGFLQRLAKRQPLAAPADTRRFFVTLEEAGHLCAIAAMAGGDRRILIPTLGHADAVTMERVAEVVLAAHGFRPRVYDDVVPAMEGLARDVAGGRYPLILTPRDTTGEKEIEVFVGGRERTEDIGAAQLCAVVPEPAPAAALADALDRLRAAVAGPAVPMAKQDIVRLVGSVVPEFRHSETGRNLDERA